MNGNLVLRFIPRWEKNHPAVWSGVRAVSGAWLLILTAILYGYDRGGWWRVLLIPAAAGHLYCAYVLYRLSRRDSARRGDGHEGTLASVRPRGADRA